MHSNNLFVVWCCCVRLARLSCSVCPKRTLSYLSMFVTVFPPHLRPFDTQRRPSGSSSSHILLVVCKYIHYLHIRKYLMCAGVPVVGPCVRPGAKGKKKTCCSSRRELIWVNSQSIITYRLCLFDDAQFFGLAHGPASTNRNVGAVAAAKLFTPNVKN